MLKLYDVKMKTFMFAVCLVIGLMSVAYVATLWNGYADLQDSTGREVELSHDNMLLAKVRFHVVQIQQFLTDVGATRDPGGFDEARENLQQAGAALDTLAVRLPQYAEQIRRIKDQVQATHDVGARMASRYISDGVDAGNMVMKELDAESERLTQELDALIKTVNTASEEVTQELVSDLDHDRNIGIGFSLAYALGIYLALLLIFLKVVPPLRELRAALVKMNSGDTDLALRLPVRGKDLIANWVWN